MKSIHGFVFKCLLGVGMAFLVRGGMEYYVGEFTDVDTKLVLIGLIFTIMGSIYELRFNSKSVN